MNQRPSTIHPILAIAAMASLSIDPAATRPEAATSARSDATARTNGMSRPSTRQSELNKRHFKPRPRRR